MGKGKIDFGGVIKGKDPAQPAPAQEVAPAPAPARKGRGRVIAVSCGLYEAERDELQHLADELGVARNALMAFFVRRSLVDYKAGKLKLTDSLKPRPRNSLNMPE